VYEAEQLSLGRRVAVKVLPFAALWPEMAVERFRHEVQVAARLEHPHIVPIYGVGCERGVHFYVMKLIDGCSLADVIRRSTPEERVQLPDSFRLAAQYGKAAAEALAFAHAHGVIHRDIKPSNLLLDRKGYLYVADFGLARSDTDVNLTRTGDVLGTPRYMRPEQAASDSKQLDARTDIYGLGATLYELLTLRPVIDVRGRSAAIPVLKQLVVTPPRSHDPSIPRPLEQIVIKCLERNSAHRYTSAAELGDDLERFLAGRPVSTVR
jgi:serine/threonine protein kinase